MTTVVFADINLDDATFELNTVSITSISLEQGECKVISVTLFGTGTVPAPQDGWIDYPTKISIDSAGNLNIEESDTGTFTTTSFSFLLEICADSDALVGQVVIDLFDGLPRPGTSGDFSGGGSGTFIAYGDGIKLKRNSDAEITVIVTEANGNGNGNGDACITYSQGYWKTHTNWPTVPHEKLWRDILWTAPKGGDAYYIFLHQYIAAYLNIAMNEANEVNCTPAKCVTKIMDEAPGYFHGPNKIKPGDLVGRGADRVLRQKLLDWAETLDAWNNGFPVVCN